MTIVALPCYPSSEPEDFVVVFFVQFELIYADLERIEGVGEALDRTADELTLSEGVRTNWQAGVEVAYQLALRKEA